MIYPIAVESKSLLFSLDLGLRFGWALYTQELDLIAYGSRHCGSVAQFKALAYSSIKRLPHDSHVYVEGGGPLLKYWRNPAEKRSLYFRSVHAEQWRSDTLPITHQYHVRGTVMKAEAIKRARPLILAQSGKRAKTLRHDAAEAILMGWWALYQIEWCSEARFKEGLALAQC